MNLVPVVLSMFLLGQAENKDESAADRAAAAAERAAAAAERSARAAERIAEAVAPAGTGDAPATAPPAAPAAEWAGSMGLSLISFAGNTETLTAALNLAAERKTAQWVWGAKAYGIYGQSRGAEGGDIEVVALAAGASLRGDRRFSQTVAVFVSSGVDTDHVKSLEYRVFGEGGTGITWLERKEGDLTRLLLRSDLGLRYAQESRFQYYPVPQDVPDLTLVAPRLGLAFRYMLNDQVGFFQDVEVLPNVVGAPRVLVNSLSKVSARLTKAVALGAGFEVRYDSEPAPGKRTTDTGLTVNLEIGF